MPITTGNFEDLVRLGATPVSGVAAVPTVAQWSFTDGFTSGATVNVVFANQASGNANIVIIASEDTTHTISSVTDTAGNVYALKGSMIDSATSGTSNWIYSCDNIVGGPTTVKVTFSSNTANQPEVFVFEVAGALSTGCIDTAMIAWNSTVSSGTSISVTSATTTASANELAFSYVVCTGAGAVSAGAGWTAFINGNTSAGGATPSGGLAESKSVAAQGTSVVGTINVNSGQGALIVVFGVKPATAGGDPVMSFLGPDLIIGNTSVGSTASLGFNNTAGDLVLAGAATGNATVQLPKVNTTLLTNVNLSAGTTSQNLQSVVFSNYAFAGISFGLNGSTITGSASAGSSASVAISAGTVSTNLLSLVMSNSNDVSFGLNGSTITATVHATGDYYDNIAALQPNGISTQLGSITNFSGSVSSFFVAPLEGFGNMFPFDMTAGTCFFPDVSLSGSTATMSIAFTSGWLLGIYTLNGSSLSLLNSASVTFGFGAASTNNSTGFAGGFRYGTFPSGNWSSSPVFKNGSRYWLGWLWTSAGALNQTGAMAGAFALSTGQRSGFFGASSLTGTSNGPAPFFGIYSAQTAALPGSIGSNQLQKTASMAGFVPHLVMANNAALTVF